MSTKDSKQAETSTNDSAKGLGCSAPSAFESVYLKERRMPDNPCPECAAQLNACTGISSWREGTIPTTGGITVCAYCGTLLEFAEVGYVHASQQRLNEIPDQLQRAIERTIGMAIVARPVDG